MAIYHLTTRSVSRTDSRSAQEAATYILRTGDYARDHDEVAYDESGHMPAFASDPLTYWKAADRHERRNGRLYQSLEYALPVELNDDGRRDLAVQFVHRLTATEQLPYTLAIHHGKGHNPHCHLIISERRNDGIARPRRQWFRRYNAKVPGQGGARKSTTLRPREWLTETRRAWADLCNLALEDAGHDTRIDHRKLEAQGITRRPGKHLGPERHKMMLKGMNVRIANDIGMTAADIGPPAPLPFAPPAARPTPVRPTAKDNAPERERRAPQQDRTARAVQRQAAAMGCEYYDVGIQHATGELVEHRWALQALLDNLQRMKHLNAQGRNILIRPSFRPLPGMVLVDGLSQDSVERMRADGYEPVATIETAPNVHQVWVRVGEQITKSRRDKIASYLAEHYGGDVAAAGANSFGRLAGFTSGESLPGGQRPFVTLKQSDSSGKIASAAADVLRATQPKPRHPEDGPAPGEDGPGAG